MRRLLLATVSVLALSLGAMALGYAQGNTAAGNTAAGNSGNAAPSTMHAVPQSANPMMGGPAQANQTPPAGQTSPGQTSGAQSMGGGQGHHQMRAAEVSRREVKEVQERLRQDNLYRGHIDGLLGPETRQALRQYQSANGLRVTARLDQQTLESLLGTAGTGVGSSSPPRGNHHSRTMGK